MQIDRIDDIQRFDQLRNNWDAVYSVDPNAHIFLSWAWIKGWLDAAPINWLILALRPDDRSPYVAFFPLIARQVQKFGINNLHVLHMGGYPVADYTGFVCNPEHEELSVEVIALYLRRELQFSKFHMTD
ncbi:unnamed protein product, partial [marine sediment metagenome]